MRESAEERAIVWLCACADLEPRERVALLRAAGSPEELFLHFEKFSAEVIDRGKKGVYKIKDLDARKRETDELFSELDRRGYFAVTPFSDDYPAALKAADPPLALFGAGNRALLKTKMFCIVGSRITPPWAEKLGKAFSEELSKKFTIVTGLAEGGDRAAISGALSSGNLVCILPCGLDECYPAAHASLKEEVKKRGLLLSEYPPRETVKKYSFHARNRILAGISEGTLVLSAGARSGALITASFAAEYGRDVFAFPYSLGAAQGEGCNELIKKGAYLCTETDDILSCYGMRAEKGKEVALSPAEERTLSVLREGEELHASVIAQRAGLQIYEAAAVLSSLELKGLAVKCGGNRFRGI